MIECHKILSRIKKLPVYSSDSVPESGDHDQTLICKTGGGVGRGRESPCSGLTGMLGSKMP